MDRPTDRDGRIEDETDDVEETDAWGAPSFSTPEELDALLEEGLRSGVSTRTFDEIIAEALQEAKAKGLDVGDG